VTLSTRIPGAEEHQRSTPHHRHVDTQDQTRSDEVPA
jgi:hypothetical protein